MRGRGLELHRHLDPFAKSQFLHGTVRHESRQREATVNSDAHMEPNRVEAGYRALEPIGWQRGAGGRGAGLERHILGAKAETRLLAGLGRLLDLHGLSPDLDR